MYPPPIIKNNSLNTTKLDIYKLEAIISKQISIGKTQYLIKQKGYSYKYNIQYSKKDLSKALSLD